ncbi:hypothetical protein E8D34_01320 [Nocardioides sp. GY 10113]|uniref:EsaB/YukD family protein n=1 Tax=Nocardioides sp. GY 10113 TaxID=2569761 RepID=UPI0010A7707C|nr:EsaB/YukD family protein [Nocardioides sp. GY 10113]TIC89168.1 hypothetical protein E8D34_01320 [Nocardioides sp. GY 10113]
MSAVPGLVRVTVVAGPRRADLALPAGVPVAELLPELAAGLVRPGPARGVRLVTAGGVPLEAGADLTGQGVVDGAVLALVAEAEVPPPRVYDDPVEALLETTAARPPARVAGCSAPEVGLALVAVAAVLALAAVVGAAFGLGGLGGIGAERALAVALVVAALVPYALPRAALAAADAADPTAGPTAGPIADPTASAERVAAADRLLLTALGGAAATTALSAPVVAGLGAAGALLATDACLVLMLSVRDLRTPGASGTTRATGLLGLGGIAVALARAHPGWSSATALALAGAALLALRTTAGARARAAGGLSAPRRRRLADLAEGAALVALAPSLVLALDGTAPGAALVADLGARW